MINVDVEQGIVSFEDRRLALISPKDEVRLRPMWPKEQSLPINSAGRCKQIRQASRI
jgi:hypothetical protein